MSTICYEIDKPSRNMLLHRFPPKYPEIKYDHITIEIGGINAQATSPAESVEVVGIADDGNGLEALIVRVNGTPTRADGKAWHITASFDPSKNAPAIFDVFAEPGTEKEKPYRAVTSNGLLDQVLDENGNPKEPTNPKWKVKMFDKPITIQTHPTVQYNKMELKQLQEKNRSI